MTQLQHETDEARGRLVLLRLASAGLIGLLTVSLVTRWSFGAVTGAAFGGGVAGFLLGLLLTVLVVPAAALHVAYRSTGGQGNALRWALGTAGAGSAIAVLGSAAWWLSGREFWQSPSQWQAVLAVSFVVAAGCGTRAVRWPSALVAGAVLMASLAVLVPEAASRLPEAERRGCIASSAEEAARNCP